MNKEWLGELIRARDEEREADRKNEQERKAKYLEAIEIERSVTARLVALFDGLGIPKDGSMRGHEFSLGADSDSARRARTTVLIRYMEETQPGAPRRGWLGTEKPGDPEIVATDEVSEVLISTTLGAETIERHKIYPYDRDTAKASSSTLQRHFYNVGNSSEPRYDPADPDSLLGHLSNISETVDLVASLNPTDPAPELPAS
jgi:hypothetical protein